MNSNNLAQKSNLNSKSKINQNVFSETKSSWNKENMKYREPYREIEKKSGNQIQERNQDSLQSRFEYTHYI
jgi:hypothetical protein